MTQKIGIIGDGNVGSALEKGLKSGGHEVQSVGKEPERVREVAGWAETIVLAVPFDKREEAFQEMGDAVKGKLVVDVTNAVTSEGFVASAEQSGAEELQDHHRDVQIVKAFNTVFAENMENGHAAGEALSLFVAGDDEKGRRSVMALGRDLGFDPVDAGELENARGLEVLGYLNMTLGYKMENGTDTGFRYVHPGAQDRKGTISAEAAE